MRLTDEQVRKIKDQNVDWSLGSGHIRDNVDRLLADREALLAEIAELQTRMAEGFAARDGQIENGAKMIAELERKERGYHTHIYEAEQYLGKALGYPWYKDDQKNFPGATEKDGVCTGEHVVDTIAFEAANRIQRIEGENAKLRRVVEAARVFRDEGTTLTVCNRGPCQRVNEKRDRSDPQAILYKALAALEPTNVPDAKNDKR